MSILNKPHVKLDCVRPGLYTARVRKHNFRIERTRNNQGQQVWRLTVPAFEAHVPAQDFTLLEDARTSLIEWKTQFR